MSDYPPRALVAFVRGMDRFAEWCGRVFCWLVIPLVAGIVYEVLARYFFRAPTIWAYDVAYMLYGTHFMLGTAYTLMRIGHVRTDMLYQNWSVRRQNWVDLIGYVFFFFPAMAFFLYYGYQESSHAWAIGETSDASPWRPIVYPFKTVIPVTAFLLIVQGIAEVMKNLYAIRTGRLWVKREMMEIG